MPVVRVGNRILDISTGSNLLDALNEAGCSVPYGCRAGICQACLVRCVEGHLEGQTRGELSVAQRSDGWCLACQCSVSARTAIEVFDPAQHGTASRVLAADWLSPTVRRLVLEPVRKILYRAGQHITLWTPDRHARPYSFASMPGEENCLEFHVGCADPGRFRDFARRLEAGDRVQLGQVSGALSLDEECDEDPLLLIGRGTGIAPLWAIAQQAVREPLERHVRLVHVASGEGEHYLARLQGESDRPRAIEHYWVSDSEFDTMLAAWRSLPRRMRAFVCGNAAFVERVVRQLYLAGLPRPRIRTEAFLPNKN
ncbi:iron-sulfur-binding ferredoxin reductase [Pseudomonas sp. Marseille-QA0892]